MEVGAGWTKQDKNNKPYISGFVEILGKKFYINIFKNEKKEGGSDKQPDYRFVSFSEGSKNNEG